MSTFRGLYSEQSLSFVIIDPERSTTWHSGTDSDLWWNWNVTFRRTLVGGTFETSSEFVILHTFEVNSNTVSITKRKYWTVTQFQSVVTFPIWHLHTDVQWLQYARKRIASTICIVCIVCTDRWLYTYEDVFVAMHAWGDVTLMVPTDTTRVLTKLPTI